MARQGFRPLSRSHVMGVIAEGGPPRVSVLGATGVALCATPAFEPQERLFGAAWLSPFGLARAEGCWWKKDVWVKFCKKRLGILERVSISFLCVGAFSGAIQQTGAQTYP